MPQKSPKSTSSSVILPRSFPAPYLSQKQKAPQTVNHDGLLSLIKTNSAVENLGICLSILGGLMYLCFSPLFNFIRYLLILVFPPGERSFLNRSAKKSYGIISQYTCPKTGRTYITRFLDPKRDINDCARLLLDAFNKDPFATFAQPDIGPRHMYGQEWYRFMMESPQYDVILQEWAEQELVVGLVVFDQREHNVIRDILDYSKWMSNMIRFLGISPMTSYRQLQSALAIEAKFRSVCKNLDLSDVIHCKYLAVEKGHQGMGIGSNLLRTVSVHVHGLGRYAYLESSNIVNVPLYERFGFRVVEEWKFCPGSPSLYLMFRSLDDDSTTDTSVKSSPSKSTSSASFGDKNKMNEVQQRRS